ncbi:hypothetical protein BEWA_024220 [Theileria equi strain WA]|uniref:RING-type domain-containing protein n=1 Tax=Theileria equi strain WA TaxID=1537102 RepID=L0AWE7_THEEQ|nr:hypothetical protein BEWA_024220 [Theileria equi strain WA]AFZ79573.1 hypothetical protein BEWA_024220 [Theileria equi strain WA]|eukprot:XP_004829239.1 hypothetical protein BEWA_024220 [Theileria equi strain WA]
MTGRLARARRKQVECKWDNRFALTHPMLSSDHLLYLHYFTDLSTMSEANMQNRPLRPQVNGYGIYKYERTGSRDSLMTNYFTSLDSLVGDFRGLMKNPAYSGNTPRTSTPIRMRSEAMMRQYSEPLVMQIGLDEQRRVNHHRPTRQGRSPRVSRDSNRQWRNNRCMSGSGSSTRNNRAEPMYPPGLSNHIAKTLTIDPTNGNSFSVNSIDTEDNVVPPPMESGLPEQYIAKFPLVRYGPRARSTHCNICLEDYTDGEILRKLPCRHIYHRDCVDTWFRRRSICPTCRLDYVVRAVA